MVSLLRMILMATQRRAEDFLRVHCNTVLTTVDYEQATNRQGAQGPLHGSRCCG